MEEQAFEIKKQRGRLLAGLCKPGGLLDVLQGRNRDSEFLGDCKPLATRLNRFAAEVRRRTEAKGLSTMFVVLRCFQWLSGKP